MPTKRKPAEPDDTQGQYSFEVRFGGPAIAEGVVPIPRIVVDTYALLGVTDQAFAWIVHLLAFKWTEKPPFPKRTRLNCQASDKTQQRIARRLRELGLLFTTRRMRHGKMVSLIYDFDSLLHNAVRMHEALEAAIDRHLTLHPFEGHPDDRNTRIGIRDKVKDQVARKFKIELPEDVATRLRTGAYQDVPPPWDAMITEPDALFAQEDVQPALDLPADPPEEKLAPAGEPNAPADVKSEPSKPAKRSWTVPAAAGGADTEADAVGDLICQYNQIAGMDRLPPKKQGSMRRRIRRILDQWGGGTLEQCRLAMQAWTVHYSWKASCNPHADSFVDELGMLLVAVKDGAVTLETIQAEQHEQEKADQRRAQMDRRAGIGRNDPAAYQSWQRIAPRAQDERARPQEPEVPKFWQHILADLERQMTQATFHAWLNRSTARQENGAVVVIVTNERALDWLQHRLNSTIERTARRLLGEPDLAIRYEVAPHQDS
jgi:hypothetical protein